MYDAVLCDANLSRADLTGADLEGSLLLKSIMESATLTGCRVYGTSAWDVKLNGAIQSNLIITPKGQPIIQVDNLEVAQFIYLLLNNKKLWDVIDTIGNKAVLILGRFSTERKVVLDGIREELRRHGYLPILFDFDPVASQDTMATISTLAHLSRFIIADLTDARSVIGESERITTVLESVPIQLILQSQGEMIPIGDSLLLHQSVLKPYFYRTQEELIASLEAKVIVPANAKANALQARLAEIRKQFLPWRVTG